MKKIIFPFITLLAITLTSCDKPQEKSITTIKLSNPTDFDLKQKAVGLALDELPKQTSSSKHPLLLIEGDTLASQLSDSNKDGRNDELFFVIDIVANASKNIQFKWVEKQPQYETKTSIRFGKRDSKDQPVKPATSETLSATDMPKALGFQKYQTDGPTWENDKVAFRHYLDGRNAIDVYGKKIAAISPENVGLDSAKAVVDNYHTMEDWGRDVFPVGNSAGLGGFGVIANGKIQRLGILVTDTLNNIEKTSFKILEEGPVKSSMEYSYTNWNTEENTYQAKEITTIWPGMYAFQNTVAVNGLAPQDTLAIGLSNINNKKGVEELKTEKWTALIQHDSLTYDRTWVMGTAIILPSEKYTSYSEAPDAGKFMQSYLAKVNVKNDESITYYGVSGWELSQEKRFKDVAFFKQYVTDLANTLYTELDISINTENQKISE
ncbi:DUF4861 family protein [Leeuwenhoekiella marinoflava]|uniref:DUF4861 domain-containing protein n=2 Tax=Leeuwenhoekiella marinoflava TaxID=988 RepID=A0A4Q0PJF8_9FLAO|nr:DUF4861 family protein [Leeuwenhoekiella marinoflava]RXG27603.1 putative protein DUF4861 [Leeuwenhoekiella marinoflava]SHF66816.1 protein of unknown function [Leeuwenhoekiella marinoflava DSM 3653]